MDIKKEQEKLQSVEELIEEMTTLVEEQEKLQSVVETILKCKEKSFIEENGEEAPLEELKEEMLAMFEEQYEALKDFVKGYFMR